MPYEQKLNFNNILIAMAIRILARGPAAPTNIISCFGFFNPEKLTGTGFAQPKRNGDPEIIRKTGKIIVPMGSICARGFRVSLPAYLAVGSPRLYAIHPCATSWIMTARKKSIKDNARLILRLNLENERNVT